MRVAGTSPARGLRRPAVHASLRVPIPCPIHGVSSVTSWTISYENDHLIWADAGMRR